MSKNMKKAYFPLVFILLLSVVGLVYYLNIDKRAGSMNIEFIRTKNDADCTLICDEKVAVLIDTGEKCDADVILQSLRNRSVDKVDYLVISHGDKDHVGSAKVLLDSIKIDKVILSIYEDDEIEELVSYIEAKNIPIIDPGKNETISIGDLTMVCFPAQEAHYKKENNYSLVVKVTHGDIVMLFTGDAQKKRSIELEQISWGDIDLYKVPHHGRANDESENLFKLVSPRIAVVTSDDCDVEIKDSARECSSELYFTVPDGLILISDGTNIYKP